MLNMSDDTSDIQHDEHEEHDDDPQQHPHTDGDDIYQWASFTGLRVKPFTAEELEMFRLPFAKGWKREIVLRGTVTTSGKKIGDVYYFTPDAKTKLRSYVEMGLYLKRNTDDGLKPENFTFARQPIYKPPYEIVRHAMQRHSIVPPANDNGQHTSNSNSNDAPSDEHSVPEGRSKRKRVAPSRFEDEEWSDPKKPAQPLKIVPKPPKPLTLQEKRRVLQHQLLEQINEQRMKDKTEESRDLIGQPMVMSATRELSPKIEMRETNNHESHATTVNVPRIAPQIVQQNDQNSILRVTQNNNNNNNVKIRVKPESVMRQSAVNNTNSVMKGEMRAPCSIKCIGRKGLLPNMMCSKCFCLFHLECVPKAIVSKGTFICPNCVTPKAQPTHLYRVSTQANGHAMVKREYIKRPKRGYKEWIMRYKPKVDLFIAPFQCINEVFTYLPAADLLSLKCASKSFNSLASQNHLWKTIQLKGINLIDFAAFGRIVVEPYAAEQLDFEGVKVEEWNFSALIDYLKSVKVLRFGAVPKAVLEEIAAAALEENPYNSFSGLEVISVKQLTDATDLSLIEQLSSVTSLQSLSLNTKNGFQNTESLTFEKLVNLKKLSLTNLKSVTMWGFLSTLASLKHLDIGECQNWTETEFNMLSQLLSLTHLRLNVVTPSLAMASAIGALQQLESLTFELLPNAPAEEEYYEALGNSLKTLTALRFLTVSSADATNNRRVYEMLCRMSSLQCVRWFVGECVVADSGDCLVAMDNDDESEGNEEEVRLIEMDSLSETLHKKIKCIVEITPQ